MFLVFLAILPAFSSDTISVSSEDWQLTIQALTEAKELLNQSETQLNLLKAQSQELKVELTKLSKDFSSMESQLNKTKTMNSILIGSISVSLVLNVVLIYFLVK